MKGDERPDRWWVVESTAARWWKRNGGHFRQNNSLLLLHSKWYEYEIPVAASKLTLPPFFLSKAILLAGIRGRTTLRASLLCNDTLDFAPSSHKV